MAYYSNGTKMIEGGQITAGIDTPVWVTNGSLGAIYDANRSNYSITLTATSPAGLTPTYELVSGSLPTGVSLNTSTGQLTGTMAAVASDTIDTFTVRAKTLLTADREFTITRKAPVVTTFSYTGSDQTFAVPAGVTKINVYMWGAAGGGGYGEGYYDKGGPGGFTDANLTVTPGDTLKVQVGQGGWNTAGTNGPLGTSRAYPWGGRPSPRGSYNTGYGGGRSAIFRANTFSAANCLAVAGGGGGSGGLGWSGTLGGRSFCGGGGGGTTGSNGHYLNVNDYGISPNNAGTQTGIGTQGLGVQGAGVEAAQFKGGDAANPEGTYSGHGGNTQGGGGDGWYGGRASQYSHSGAGGGSGYINPSYGTGTTSATPDNGHVNSADSPANPPGTGNAYWNGSAGVAVQNGTGNNGLVVIAY